MPGFDYAQGLGIVRGAPDMILALAAQPFRQILEDVGRLVVAEKPRLVNDVGTITT